jgi:hypothetical protein
MSWLRQGYVSWKLFFAELYDFFDTDTHNLGCLTKLKQTGLVEDIIVAFEKLAFRMESMTDACFRDCFVNGLKDEICAHVLMYHPHTWLEATKMDKEAQLVVSFQTINKTFIPTLKLPFPPLLPLPSRSRN